MENGKFEDECRNLLGASSYSLFTVDKLVQQLLKQTQTLLASRLGLRLLSLYQHEYCRSHNISLAQLAAGQPVPTQPPATTPERSAQLARTYHHNCADVIGDDACNMIEYVSPGLVLLALLRADSFDPCVSWSDFSSRTRASSASAWRRACPPARPSWSPPSGEPLFLGMLARPCADPVSASVCRAKYADELLNGGEKKLSVAQGAIPRFVAR